MASGKGRYIIMVSNVNIHPDYKVCYSLDYCWCCCNDDDDEGCEEDDDDHAHDGDDTGDAHDDL